MGELLAGVLAAMIDFKKPGSGAQRERWGRADWWASFLGSVEKLRITIKKEVQTIENLYAWLIRQVAPSLAVVREYGLRRNLPDVLEQIVTHGRTRIRPQHKALYLSPACSM
jgi:phage replication initiation protein